MIRWISSRRKGKGGKDAAPSDDEAAIASLEAGESEATESAAGPRGKSIDERIAVASKKATDRRWVQGPRPGRRRTLHPGDGGCRGGGRRGRAPRRPPREGHGSDGRRVVVIVRGGGRLLARRERTHRHGGGVRKRTSRGRFLRRMDAIRHDDGGRHGDQRAARGVYRAQEPTQSAAVQRPRDARLHRRAGRDARERSRRRRAEGAIHRHRRRHRRRRRRATPRRQRWQRRRGRHRWRRRRERLRRRRRRPKRRGARRALRGGEAHGTPAVDASRRVTTRRPAVGPRPPVAAEPVHATVQPVIQRRGHRGRARGRVHRAHRRGRRRRFGRERTLDRGALGPRRRRPRGGVSRRRGAVSPDANRERPDRALSRVREAPGRRRHERERVHGRPDAGLPGRRRRQRGRRRRARFRRARGVGRRRRQIRCGGP